MSGAIIYIILILFVVFRYKKQGNKKGSGTGGNRTAGNGSGADPFDQRRTARGNQAGGRPLASDGHRVPKDQDISCRRFGHTHEEFDTPRFIPHDDPEQGYIILNGVKMKLSEADRYEDRI